MASSSSRKSGSSARSTSRRRTTSLGAGTQTRASAERPEVQVKMSAGRQGANNSGASRVGARDPRQQYGQSGGAKSGGARKRPSGARLTPEARAKRDERERRRIQNRRLYLKRTVLVGVAVVAVIVLAVLASRSSALDVRNVVVEGNSYVSTAEVLERAQVPTGTALPSVDTAAIEERLLADPWIASVEIKRSFPSTVRIVVTERAPLAILDMGTTFWYVDGTGLVLAESELETSSVLPVIRDVPSIEPTTGVVIDAAELANAITAIVNVSSDLREIVRIVKAPSVDETTLVTDTWVDIRIGDATDQIAAKSAVALEIIAKYGVDVVYIDVRDPENAVSRGLSK